MARAPTPAWSLCGPSHQSFTQNTLPPPPSHAAIIFKRGGSSSIGRAPVCGTGCCGFKSRLPPQKYSCGAGTLTREKPKIVDDQKNSHCVEPILLALMAGGRPFRAFDLHSTEGISGAPSLRLRSGQALAFFCKGGKRYCWPGFLGRSIVLTFSLPPFAKCAKDGAPFFLDWASEIKSLGHPPP